MKRKIFNTPIVTPIVTALFAFYMKAAGWTVVGKPPPHLKKFVAVVAPHTSNWDGVIVLMTSFAMKLDAYWMAKHKLFQFPLVRFMKWLGAISVDRGKPGDMVAKTSQLFAESESMVIGISPEATRGEVTRWRTGFWYIAKEANVPIVLFFIDGEHKRCGFLEVFDSTGDCHSDVELIKKKFEGFRGIKQRT